MSEDYADLVTRLRRIGCISDFGLQEEAAKAIASLCERVEWRVEMGNRIGKEHEKLKADVERLTRERDEARADVHRQMGVTHKFDELLNAGVFGDSERYLNEMKTRAEKAEAALALAQRERDEAVRLADKAAGIVLMRFTAAEDRDKAEAALAAQTALLKDISWSVLNDMEWPVRMMLESATPEAVNWRQVQKKVAALRELIDAALGEGRQG
jgi:hypothetical protein